MPLCGTYQGPRVGRTSLQSPGRRGGPGSGLNVGEERRGGPGRAFPQHPASPCWAVQLAATLDPLTLTPDPRARSHGTPFCVRLAMATPWSLRMPRREIEVWCQENQWRIGQVSWCLCGKCQPMSSAEESMCCREVDPFWALVETLNPRPDVTCLTLHPGFEGCCLNPFVLQAVSLHRIQADTT
ncbi:unnamed protein product [Arctogadus glacialis]